MVFLAHTIIPVLSGYSKIDKTKILMTNGSLMRVKSILRTIVDQHYAIIGLERQFLVFFRVADLDSFKCTVLRSCVLGAVL